MCSIIVSVLIVQAIIFPYILIAFIPMLLLYSFVQRYFVTTSRELKRLDNISRSPIAIHLIQSLDGLSVVRAYGLQQLFANVMTQRIDDNTKAFWKQNLINRWVGLRLDWMGAVLIGSTSFVCVYFADDVNAGLAGMSLSYSLLITGWLNWWVLALDMRTVV